MLKRGRILFLVLSAASSPSFATPDCDEVPRLNEICKEQISRLHPTQGALGFIAMRNELEDLEKLSEDELKAELKERVVPVVIGPRNRFYMLDNHHMVRALWEGELRNRVYVRVLKNWSKLSEENFWEQMEKAGWVRLIDDEGRRISPDSIPSHISRLPNDPYRSLAKIIRKRGAYKKTTILYAEFLWADYLRKAFNAYEFRAFDEATIVRAMKLARSEKARQLPGYIKAAYCEDELSR
jgi:hypothetical protein